MPLLGTAAMLLSFDVAEEAIAEHDEWHTHEHLPERLSIPGFIRGTRWVAMRGQPRYFVLYEVENLGTLASDAYLERLNHPTRWTSKMMRHYRGMTRGFCSIDASSGFGMGHAGLLVRFKPEPGRESLLGDWIRQDIVAPLPRRAGLGSAHLLRGALTPRMTNEQRIRGDDAGIDWALLVTGYNRHALETVAATELRGDRLADHGATQVVSALYRIDHTLSASEIAA